MLKNWKTSLFGIAAAALSLFANGHNWKQVLFSTGLAVFSLFAKDHNVSGS